MLTLLIYLMPQKQYLINHLWFFLLTIAMMGLACAQEKPNVIIVMTDDQGYGDLGCHGTPF